jgi:ABC-type transport system involved in multi-copper enzyme maturation permease subunit
MWGAVFYLEFLRGGRRLRHHFFRWLYGGWLLLMLLVGSAGAGRFVPCCLPGMCLLPTESFATAAEMLIAQQFLLALFAVPPLAAGAITEEKALGTLAELLMSGLTPWRIVAGKFLARTAQVATLSLAGVPLLCWFGGLDVVALAAVLAAEAGVLCCLAAVSILASVWVRTTSSALLGAYTVSGLLFAAVRYLGGPFTYLDPFYLVEPVLEDRRPEALGARVLVSGALWAGLTLGCLALAAWRLRPAYLRQYLDKGVPKTVRRAWWRPRIGDDPLRWKERYVEALSPLPLLRLLPRWAGVAAAAVAGVAISATTLARYLPADVAPESLGAAASRGDFATVADALRRVQDPELGFLVQGLLSLLFLAVVVNLRAAGGISGEREKGTWDALLLAGMKARDMVRGKVLGVLDSTLPYLIAYGVPAVLFAAAGGVLSVLATLGPMALAWPLMYLSAAIALERSTRYASAWKSTADSLVVTTLLLFGLVYGTAGLLSGACINLVGPLGPFAPGSVMVPISVATGLLVYAAGMGWLLLRVARDYVRGAALTITKARGELPEKRFLLQLNDTQPRPRRRRKPDEPEA